MDIDDIKILKSLLLGNNVSQTAELVNLSQPTVTIRLKKLRQQFDDPLLVRQGNAFLLTEKAKNLINPVLRLSENINHVIPSSSFDPYNDESTIYLYLSEYISDMCSQKLIDLIYAYNPNHRIKINVFPGIQDLPDNYDFSDAEIIFGAPGNIEEFTSYTVFEDELLLGYYHYPLDDYECIDYDTYCKLPHIIFAKSNEKNYVRTYIQQAKEQRRVCVYTTSLSTADTLLKTSNYVATVTKIFALSNQLKTVKLDFKLPKFALRLSYPKRLQTSQRNIWLRKICIEAFGHVMDELGVGVK